MSLHSPAWTKDLVIYEVATKAFTSPSGPESGNFESLAQRLPYLAELGINAMWLTGHSLSDSRHFYNIWTQYACIDPQQLDPSLGSGQEFRALIDEAHRLNIRVFLDVITHGVMNDSPLIAAHPNWFQGGSWGMTDYDWRGHHPDLDEWWVMIWSDCVLDYGVDGFRLDVSIYRPDLWLKIRERCANAGREIVVFAEGGEVMDGACDFFQRIVELGSNEHPLDMEQPLLQNAAAFFLGESYRVALRSDDGGHRMIPNPDPVYRTAQLSCHDCGWQDFPSDLNPYVAQGSRAVFGYGCLFTPAIPIFMAGEEFNADFVPLPALSPFLFGSAEPGRGRWLYGSQLEWAQLEQPAKRAMLSDVRRMLSIRRAERDLLRAASTDEPVNFLPVPCAEPVDYPVPYVLWNEHKAILVAANYGLNQRELRLQWPLAEMGYGAAEPMLISDLWGDEPARRVNGETLADWPLTIPGDGQFRGGLAVWKLARSP